MGSRFRPKRLTQDEEGSEGAGDDGSGDVEFEVDEEAAEDEEEDGEVGVGELGEEALAEGGLDGEDGCAVEVEDLGVAVEALDGAAVEGVEEGLIVG